MASGLGVIKDLFDKVWHIMTYLAPRQGLFAVIILISFCLHTVLMVVSTQQQLQDNREQKGERMVAQLIDEATLSLATQDRVSLSVIANRYTNEYDVTRLVITNNDDEVLVQTGDAPLQSGETISQVATQDDAVIGNVTMTLKDTSYGEIIAMQWPFVVGSLVLHILVWLLYGYVARPTKDQLNALSREAEEYYRAMLSQGRQPRYAPNTELEQEGDTQPAVPPRNTTHDIQAALRQGQEALRQEQAAQLGASAAASDDALGAEAVEMAGTEEARMLGVGEAATVVESTDRQKLSAKRAFDTVDVQIVYDDKYKLLDKLAPETANPYFALCTQLLQQAIDELLKQPLLHGVTLQNEPRFDHQGALVVLKARDSHSKVALAGAMLGKLYLMLNETIYDKHRELSRFALPVKIGVSDDGQLRAMQQLTERHVKREELLLLLPESGVKQINSHMQLRHFKLPTTVYERESLFLRAVMKP